MTPLPRAIRRPSARRLVVALVTGCVMFGALGVATSPAGAATKPSAQCQQVIQTLQSDVSAAANSGVKPGTHEADLQAIKLRDAFEKAQQQFPQCKAAIETYVAQLAAAARQAATVKGTAFWGPVGWAWNLVYYKVFNGGDIMMAMFGWALLLSPFILVFSVYAVLKGAPGSFRRPKVPEHLRTEA
ncbi:MAG TPA: hypothetical protein VFZ17_03395 [Acidimicrobiia bacterium]|nr:hypothetical protein [Acidimicrobiia bacterium]